MISDIYDKIVKIPKVKAYDADTPPYNDQVRYFLKEGDTDLFRINASTGDISLLRPLDRELVPEYTLTLVAMDTGKPNIRYREVTRRSNDNRTIGSRARVISARGSRRINGSRLRSRFACRFRMTRTSLLIPSLINPVRKSENPINKGTNNSIIKRDRRCDRSRVIESCPRTRN